MFMVSQRKFNRLKIPSSFRLPTFFEFLPFLAPGVLSVSTPLELLPLPNFSVPSVSDITSVSSFKSSPSSLCLTPPSSSFCLTQLPYNPYLAHGALSKLKFPIGNIYCIIPKKRTPQPLQLSIIITFCCNLETN